MKNFWKVLRVLLGIALIVASIVGIGTSLHNSKVEKEVEEQQE